MKCTETVKSKERISGFSAISDCQGLEGMESDCLLDTRFLFGMMRMFWNWMLQMVV